MTWVSVCNSVFWPGILKMFNPFPNKAWFLRVCSTNLLKTQREKEKLLVTSNFSFSHSVFYLFWKHLCHFQQIWSCCLQTLQFWNSLKFVVWERVKVDLNIIYFCLVIVLKRAKPNYLYNNYSRSHSDFHLRALDVLRWRVNGSDLHDDRSVRPSPCFFLQVWSPVE